ncbi:indole-3-glycerol phosphate synthase TrpC [Rubrobacter indicoceani]|uniref:indole-3-glycerol phosphate synthase TrpC n=1 Tax=Rubrobacter indicoceani TaxID=2051957 RepID=UPI000E5A7DA4|nr:indole-3-glycerol phosphate synthase TrpC [Rubrobacter indicoceani]
MSDRRDVPTVLDELAKASKKRAEDLKSSVDVERLRELAARFQKRDFTAALKAPGLSVISEIKRASPSVGFIREANPKEQAEIYADEGAACLSVLTEPERFKGSLEDLDAARNAVGIPVIRKDFTADEVQIIEAATRADAVLLIVALFDAPTLARYIELAGEVGMTALVEVHDEREAEVALRAGAEVVGVNNRDLRDFTVDLATFERLSPLLAGKLRIAESGITSVEDARRMREAGADAVLVGEAAMRQAGLVAGISALL